MGLNKAQSFSVTRNCKSNRINFFCLWSSSSIQLWLKTDFHSSKKSFHTCLWGVNEFLRLNSHIKFYPVKIAWRFICHLKYWSATEIVIITNNSRITICARITGSYNFFCRFLCLHVLIPHCTRNDLITYTSRTKKVIGIFLFVCFILSFLNMLAKYQCIKKGSPEKPIKVYLKDFFKEGLAKE